MILRYSLFFLLTLLTSQVLTQTQLLPGDVVVVGVSADMGACGLPAGSDEISFMSYRPITNGTTIDLTDNGWETGNQTLWGDGEGVLRITRMGPTVPAGTVITLHAINNAGTWSYQIVQPLLGWNVTELNAPAIFDLDPAGDQVYFMQGGTWNNQGPGGDDATYNGRILFGFNLLSVWNSNGTANQSNLHPDVMPCYHVEGTGTGHHKYVGDLSAAYVHEWIRRFIDAPLWSSSPDCDGYINATPVYASGYTFNITPFNILISCTFCDRCPPYDATFFFTLPPGLFDVVYTNGTDTFEVNGVQNIDIVDVYITDTISYWLVSVAEAGGCPIPPHFTGMATYNAPYNNPGIHTDIFVCPDHPWPINMNMIINGSPDPGGMWSPMLAFGQWYYASFGEGRYYYTFRHPQPFPQAECPADTASVDIIFPHTNGTIIEIGCDQNGTPNNIFDDAITVTLTVNGNNFGPTYEAFISSGTITPNVGITGVPTTFTLSPGSAMGPNLTLTINNINPPHYQILICEFDFLIEAPGFCSDPCDANMTASIWGNAEMCRNNCPDEPAYMYMNIDGGTAPYLMDLVVTSGAFPPMTITELPIGDQDAIQVCVDDVSEPYFDPFSLTLTLPISVTDIGAAFTILDVYDFYECSAFITNSTSYITVYDLPVLDTLVITLCSEFANPVDLTQYDEDINPFYAVNWYDGHPFEGGQWLFLPQAVNLTTVVELWALVDDFTCRNAIRVQLNIHPSPRIAPIPPIEICAGGSIALQSLMIQDLGNSMATYSFHTQTPLDSSTLINPLFYAPVDTVTIYLLASTTRMCYDTIPITIYVTPYPDFSVSATPCNLLNQTYGIQFMSSADSVHVSVGMLTMPMPGVFDVTGIPNGQSVSIELLAGSGLCKDTILVAAPNCDCPFISPPVATPSAYSICENDNIPTLSVTVGMNLVANWYDVPFGGVPVASNTLTYQPPAAISSTYYVEALDTADGCYSIRTAISFTVHPEAILSPLPDPVFCAGEMLNLSTLAPAVTNGVAGTGGWFNLSNQQPVSGMLQPVHGASWYYVFSSNPGNCQSTDTISAIVHPVPAVGIYEIVCDDIALTYNVYFTSLADIVLADAGMLIHVTGTDSFRLENIPFDTDVNFSLTVSATNCAADFTLPAPDCSCPDLLQVTSAQICSDQGMVDLSAFQGIGVNGTWQIATTPGGGNPATLLGAVLHVQNGDAGVYSLRFIRSVILTDCVDTAFFTLTLLRSPFADAGPDATVCAPDQILLNGIAGGTNAVVTWQTTGSGVIANPGAQNTSYTPTLVDITSGTIRFTLSATDPMGACPSAQSDVDITIDGTAYFILDPATLTYCDTADMVIDLDGLVQVGTTAGHWFFQSPGPNPITNNSLFNPSSLMPGNYIVFYTTTNANPPCTNDTLGVPLIIENCNCPSVALSTPVVSICSGNAVQDLNTFLITTELGTWSITSTPGGSNPATLQGSQFRTNQSDAGVYRLRFTLTNPVPGCDPFAEIDFTVIETPAVQVQMVACAPDLLSWQAQIFTTASDVIVSIGTLSSLGNNRYQISGITVGVGLILTVSNGNGLCTTLLQVDAPDCDCTLAISSLPDQAIFCPGETLRLEATVTGAKGTLTSFWISGNDTLYQNFINVQQPGTYSFVAMDALGCRAEHTVMITMYQVIIADLMALDITCPGDQDGVIILQGIQGGNGPFFISINNGNLLPVSSFPHRIENLGIGTYQIEIVDAFNCAEGYTLIVQAASSESLSLGPDQTILVGDSLLVQPVMSFVPDSFYWTGDISILNALLLNNWVSPEQDAIIRLFGIDDKGCLYSDELRIRVLLKSSIYVPNIFSPNGDGINDRIGPNVDPSVVMIDYFEIFSRWGELVYSIRSIDPINAGEGWDGTFRNEALNPGVYLYRVGVTNKRGQSIEQYGDLTLIR